MVDLTNVVIVRKKTKLEMLGASFKKKITNKKYRDIVSQSHDEQMHSFENLKKHMPHKKVVTLGKFTSKIAKGASLIVLAGGDDSLKYASAYIENTPVISINTDPKRSTGAMLESGDVDKIVKRLQEGKYRIENLTRIDASINGKKVTRAMSIYALLSNDSEDNVRYEMTFGRTKEVHRVTSGLIVYTGTGVTDWTKGAGKYTKVPLVKKDEKKIAWVVREPMDTYSLQTGVCSTSVSIVPHKENLKISPDGIKYHSIDVKRGDKVTFTISKVPLRKVRLT